MSLYEVTIELRGFKDKDTASGFAYHLEQQMEETLDKAGVGMNTRVVQMQEPEYEQ